MTYADCCKAHQPRTSLDCEGCKNQGWLVRSGWFTYPDIGDVQIMVLRLVNLNSLQVALSNLQTLNPQVEVFERINELGQSANLHSETISTSYRQLSVCDFATIILVTCFWQ